MIKEMSKQTLLVYEFYKDCKSWTTKPTNQILKFLCGQKTLYFGKCDFKWNESYRAPSGGYNPLNYLLMFLR